VSGGHRRTRARPRSGPTPSRTRPGRSWPTQAAGRDGAIFRGEALESRARDRRAPEIEIHLDTAWIRRLYRLALGLVAAGIVVVMTARTAQCDYGTSVITEPGDRNLRNIRHHVGVVISRHKRAGRIEQRDGKLYAMQSTGMEQGAAV